MRWTLFCGTFPGSPRRPLTHRRSMEPGFPPAFARLRLVSRGLPAIASAKAGGRPTLWPLLLYSLRARGPQELEEDGAASPVDDSLSSSGRKRALGRRRPRLGLAHIITQRSSARRKPPSVQCGSISPASAGDGEAVPREPAQSNNSPGILLARRRTSEWPTILAGTTGGAPRSRGEQGKQRLHLLFVNGR